MLSLNLLPPSNVTVSKSRSRCPINAPLLDPNLVNRTQKHRNASCSSFGFRNSSSSSSHPVCQISKSGLDFGRFLGHPFGVSSRFSSQTLGAAAGAPQESSPDGEIEVLKPNKNLKLAVVFGLWYFQNIVFNIYNKKVLNIFPYPWLLASFQLLCGSVWMFILWSLKLQPCPKIDKSFIVALLGPALFHTIGHISACVSFSKVAVSFTHVIKSAEPVFSVVFSSFLVIHILYQSGCQFSPLSLVAHWLPLLKFPSTLKYTLTFVSIPGGRICGGSQWVAGYHKAIATIGKPTTFYLWVMLSGIFYHLYNQSSYEALDDISPLSFSVGNTMKRVVVIIATVLVFRNPVRPLNALGSAIAIFGTFLYSQATAKKPKVEEKKN
ncbi:Xylulose 5-phosphate/phosphate translocator, chloroplastic [Sesamum angolense]|uniref:Xylulose 5-phosphate/phosphate translocator, chloroplastic n=1 Tax=Sesamum angolense TaxID=2727404 RepID=A0AAE2BTT7_9LAMI|nr:Xylulose 5-phosphate/phosphate translocator, chloroplastic [Sesamum angolense]